MNQPTTSPAPPEASTWRPINGPFQRWPRISDFALAALSFFMTMVMWSPGDSLEPRWAVFATLLLIGVGSLSLCWRRTRPVGVHLTIVAASALTLLLGETNDGLFAMVFSLYSLGRYSDDRRASLFGLAAALALVGIDLFLMSDADLGSVFAALFIIGLWYLGRRLRFRGEYLRLLEERADYHERQRTVDAERAVTEERTRIARELHDIVAHQVSLMTVQAGAAKTVAREHPDAAVGAMDSVEKAGRQALNELRQALGVLRPENADTALAPQPGLEDLSQLVKELSDAGLDVDLAVTPIPARIPASTDLAVYRIVQESLTNVLKHAGGDVHVLVEVKSEREGVRVSVTDDGKEESQLPGSGHGITGMRERAESLGGQFDAGPVVGGGFRVTAWLPLEASAT